MRISDWNSDVCSSDLSARDLRQRASHRLVELGATPMPAASIAAPLPGAVATTPRHAVKKDNAAQKAVSQASKPVQISWLPDVVNASLTELGHRMHNNGSPCKPRPTPHPRPAAQQRTTKERKIA